MSSQSDIATLAVGGTRVQALEGVARRAARARSRVRRGRARSWPRTWRPARSWADTRSATANAPADRPHDLIELLRRGIDAGYFLTSVRHDAQLLAIRLSGLLGAGR